MDHMYGQKMHTLLVVHDTLSVSKLFMMFLCGI